MAFNPKEHLTPLKGKDYLQVMWRLVWFREDHPLWDICTTMVHYDTEKNLAVFRAIISDENGNPRSCGHGSETQKDFNDYLEKAETKAVGRALAMLGYGTQFAPELDEGDRVVDSPVSRATPSDPRDYILKSGRYSGQTLGAILADKDGRAYLESLVNLPGINDGLKNRVNAALNS